MSMMTNSAMSKHLALTNSFRSYPSKVPMFLQKLYTILEDQSTDGVISWADDGASFYVHDQDALAKHHLPHWFKHNKYASFVRQLNMYGFHKIPHLQQGLISEADSSQFMHPCFHRGREEQLVYIERKKQVKEQSLDVDAPVVAENSFDMNAILNAMEGIRRTQAQITRDLSELKQTDRVLWDEANKAHQRYQQQQGTINRIVKFLANLLGQLGHSSGAVGLSNQDQGGGDNSPPPPQQSRLMIEDRTRGAYKNNVGVVADDDRPFAHQPPIDSPSSSYSTSPYSEESDSAASAAIDSFETPAVSNDLASALNTIMPQDWEKVMDAFPDFLSPDFLSLDRCAPPLPDGLISFNNATFPHPSDVSEPSMFLSGEPIPQPHIDTTSRGFNSSGELPNTYPVSVGRTTMSESPMVDLSAFVDIPPDPESPVVQPPVYNVRPFNLAEPPPPKNLNIHKKRKSDDGPALVAKKRKNTI